MKISVTQANLELPFTCYEKYLPLLTDMRRENIMRCHWEKGKIISLVTELLIRYEIKQQLGLEDSQISFTKNPHGKLHLSGYKDYHFSISHSGSYIAFASSASPVGIDIERIREPNLKVSRRFFTAAEHLWVTESSDVSSAFFQIWTAKEAYVKMLGTGFSKPITSFDVLKEEPGSLLFHRKVDGYMLAVCGAGARHLHDSDVQKIKLSELLELFPKQLC